MSPSLSSTRIIRPTMIMLMKILAKLKCLYCSQIMRKLGVVLLPAALSSTHLHYSMRKLSQVAATLDMPVPALQSRNPASSLGFETVPKMSERLGRCKYDVREFTKRINTGVPLWRLTTLKSVGFTRPWLPGRLSNHTGGYRKSNSCFTCESMWHCKTGGSPQRSCTSHENLS